ncbi:DUF3231 family protein [Metabacillus sp. B2-18]|uniref:DUF3231 family protein n=1 Tax=Metabacillus sp. B2-18 TaxID=2897333 RepID=UPI001E2E0DE1|nr:DUF3231 family protein [Metabacillus sp. B2-18]UGB28939.1 DUF3231 family protein [Metabacillus sp. B2-18]
MESHHVRLTASEIGGLWTNYVSDSMFICVYKYFLAHVEDKEIKSVLEHALDLAQQHVSVVTKIFTEEKHAIPEGFTEKDVDIKAPKLFTDEFFLFYTKQMAKGALVTYSALLPHTFRNDIREHFMSCISSTMELFNDTTNIMLSKGLQVRTPYIPYLKEVDMVEKQRFLAGWIGEQRPLTAMEITNFYANLQTNFLGGTLVTAFGQVARTEDVRSYMREGKKLAKKHTEIMSKYLKHDDLPAPTPWDAYVLVTKEPPFSDKLMMFQVSMMSAAGMGNYGTAIAASPRRDIAAEYSKLLGEVGLFAENGASMLIKHKWMERPPHAVDRNELMK